MSISMSMLAPGPNRAQFLTANRNTQVCGRSSSYHLRFRRQHVRQPHKLPTVLSQDEVVRLIDAAPNRLYRMILVLLYATGVAGPKRQGSRSKTRQPAHGHPHPPGQGRQRPGCAALAEAARRVAQLVAVEEARAAISFPAPLVSAAVSVGQYTEFCARTTRPLPLGWIGWQMVYRTPLSM